MKLVIPRVYLWLILTLSILIGLRVAADSVQSTWADPIGIPIALILLPWGFVAWALVVYGTLWTRAKSPIVLTESQMRNSANSLTPLGETTLGGDPFPPMSLYLVGGGAYAGFAISDKEPLLVRNSAVEKLNRKTLLVYAPTQPVRGEYLSGLAAAEHDQAVRASFSGFAPKAGSLLHYSLLDSLHGMDSQKLRAEQAYIIDKHAPLMTATRNWVHEGPKRFIKEMRALALAMRRDSPREKVGKFFSPSNEQKAAQDAERERIQ